MWQRRVPSVRVSLTLWYVGAMVAVLAVYAGIVFAFVDRSLSQALNDQLRADGQWAAATADHRPDGTPYWFDEDRNGGEGSLWFQAWTSSGRAFRSAVAERNPIPASGGLASQSTNESIVSVADDARTVRLLTRRTTLYGRDVVIQVARPEEGIHSRLRQLIALLALGLPPGVLIAGIGGYYLARRALAPVDRMAESVRSITAQRLHDRVPVHNAADELGRLASVVNETLERLESSFNRMRRFTADVSHELRTPLTAIRAVGEVGLRGRSDAGDHALIIGSMLEEADRLAALVDRLLDFSRAELEHEALRLEPLDCRMLAEEVVSDLGVLAEDKRQRLSVESPMAVPVVADRFTLRQALVNLVDNAIKYTAAGGDIRVRLTESHVGVLIDVIDDGPGVSDDLRRRMFERHFRGHEGPDIGGSGLGLSIAKWSVEANGGRLDLNGTAADRGSCFRITLPAPGGAHHDTGASRGRPRTEEWAIDDVGFDRLAARANP